MAGFMVFREPGILTQTKVILQGSIILLILILGAGCTNQSEPQIAEITSTPIPPTQTTVPASTSTVEPTYTPQPTDIPWEWKQIADVEKMDKDTVSAIVSDPENSKILYAGMNNAGVYKSVDGGLTWSPSHMGLANTNITSMVIDPRNTSRILVGTDVGIYQTLNGGDEWSYFVAGYQILMDPSDPDHLYSLDMSSIHETRDGGNTWNEQNLEKYNFWELIVDPVNFNVFYATDIFGQRGNAKGVYKSIDNGKTWTFIGLEGNNVYSIAAAVDNNGNTVLYAGGNRTFISKDDGANWVEQPYACNFLPSQPGISDTVFCYNYSGLVFLSPGKANKSFSGLWNKYIESVHIVGEEHQITAGGRGFYYSIDDGKTWDTRNAGIGATRMELKADPFVPDQLFLASYMGQDEQDCVLYRSDDAGKSWKVVISGNHVTWCGPVFDDKGNLYVIHSNTLIKSMNSGDSWSNIILPMEVSYGLSIDPWNPGRFFINSFDLYISTDFGSTWSATTRLSGDPYTPYGRVYFSSDGAFLYSIRGAFYSSDGGETWNECKDPNPYQAPNSDTQLVIDPENSEHSFLATSGNSVLQSTDHCQSWQKMDKGITNQYVNTIIMDPEDPSMLYAGTQDGVFVTFDAGQSWQEISSGLINEKIVYSLQIDSEGKLFAATPYGIYQLIK